MKICKYCKATEEETRIINNDTCRKHYLQIRKYGTTRRSIYDNNEIIIINNMVIMSLYNKDGEVIAKTKFDLKFLSDVAKFKWYLKGGYVRGTGKDKKLFLHRFITDCPDGKIIDHIDRDPLNNLSENLRICTQAENSRNREYKKTTKHVGIKKTPSGKWSANITVMYKTKHLGTFKTIEEAIDVRLLAEAEYFKEFSTNT